MRNLIIEEYNNSDSIKECSFSSNFNQYSIENPSKYKLSITRLKVPSSRLSVFHLTQADASKYWMRLKIPSAHAQAVNDVIDSGIVTMPVMEHYSQASVIEVLNRMLYRSYEECMLTLTSDNSTKNFTMAHIGQTSGAISSTYSSLKTSLSFIKVKVNAIANAVDNNLRIYLTHIASSTKVLLMSSTEFNSVANTFPKYIHEGGYYDFSMDPTETNLKPIDSLLAFKDLDPNSDWEISYTCNTSDNILIDIDLEIGSSDNIKSAPFVLLDSNNFLSLNYEAYYKYLNIDLEFSSFVQKMLGFSDHMNISQDQTYFNYAYNTQLIDHANLDANLTHTQAVSSYYQLSNLNKIVLTSSSLQTQGDQYTNDTSENILSDFTIDTSIPFSNLTFSITHNPFRKYRLLNQEPLKRLDIQIYAQYKNGQRVLMQFEPSEDIFIRLSLFPDDEKTYLI